MFKNDIIWKIWNNVIKQACFTTKIRVLQKVLAFSERVSKKICVLLFDMCIKQIFVNNFIKTKFIKRVVKCKRGLTCIDKQTGLANENKYFRTFNFIKPDEKYAVLKFYSLLINNYCKF